MSQSLSELDRRSQIIQVLQWFKDDDYLLQCFLDDPDGTLFIRLQQCLSSY